MSSAANDASILDGEILIDSHCHLQSLEPGDRIDALAAARERGIDGFLLPCIQLSEVDDILEFCHSQERVWCALGVHPHEARTWKAGDTSRLEALLDDPKVVAVGECGLDFHYDTSPRKKQEEVMRTQWHIAQEQDLPVVIHNRDSNEKMLEVLGCGEFQHLKADFHSFAGGRSMAETLIERDFYLGVTGMVTFKAADNIREVLPALPKDRCLVETDTPYLAPIPYRGKPNRPAYVYEVAQRVAQEWEMPLSELARQTTENFFRCYPKAASS
ncbi:MAG: TatD family hydrolase [Deltaproteobacteria bacterium]|nr:TatD family hydrolase [Deltaproteobacteria bacterium]